MKMRYILCEVGTEVRPAGPEVIIPVIRTAVRLCDSDVFFMADYIFCWKINLLL
jgi:hypothetical protein